MDDARKRCPPVGRRVFKNGCREVVQECEDRRLRFPAYKWRPLARVAEKLTLLGEFVLYNTLQENAPCFFSI